MHTNSISLWLALALSAGTFESTTAQSGGGAGGGGSSGGGSYASGGGRGSIVRLVTFPEAQQDLGLSQGQQAQLITITGKFNTSERRLFDDFNAEATRGPWGLERINTAAAQNLARARQEILRVLTPAQARRMEQISLQELGAEALSRPEVARALNLTQAQQLKLKRLQQQAERQIAHAMGIQSGPSADGRIVKPGATRREVLVGGTNAPGEASATAGVGGSVQRGLDSINAITQAAERRMLEEVLTPQQQARLKELQGKPCPLTPRYIPRGGGGAGGGGGGSYGSGPLR